MIKIFSKVFCLLLIAPLISIANAQGFVMGEMQVVNRHGEKLYAQIPLHGMTADGYSTLSGQVVGFDERIDFLDFSFKSKGPQIYFVITSSKTLTSELPVQVFLSYKGTEKNAEYIIVPPNPPAIEVPESVSLLTPAPNASLVDLDASDESKYVELTKQSAIIEGDRIILPFRYEVRSGDSISTIVNRHVNPYNARFHHTVLAMYHYNPNAFRNGDINSLIAGRILNVPSIEEFFSIDQTSARKNYHILANGGSVSHEELVKHSVFPQISSEKQLQVSALQPDLDSLRKLAQGLNSELLKLQSKRKSIDEQIDENEKRLAEINAMLSNDEVAVGY